MFTLWIQCSGSSLAKDSERLSGALSPDDDNNDNGAQPRGVRVLLEAQDGVSQHDRNTTKGKICERADLYGESDAVIRRKLVP